MSAPPTADFVAGCRECDFTMGSDSLEDVAWFYTCHRTAGHDVEWMWGTELTPTVDPVVTDDGEVSNVSAVIGGLVKTFHPAQVPAELLFEICLNAGGEKGTLEAQLDELPEQITDRVSSFE